MAQKQVRICDRCGAEREYFSTTDWTVVKISEPIIEGKEQAVEHDLCGPCTNALRHFIAGYVRAAMA